MKKRPVVIGTRARRQVAFVGPYGVGKTTAVRTLSDLPVASTEVKTIRSAQDGSARTTDTDAKQATTVGIDYGQWRGPYGVVGLYGTPGQERFDMIRDQAISAATSLVLLLDGTAEDRLDEAEKWLKTLSDGAASEGDLAQRLTVAITRLTDTDAAAVDDYRPLVDRFGTGIALVTADPRDREDVARIVLSALRLPDHTRPEQELREEVG